MKTNKILLTVLLLIIICQAKNILEPEIKKMFGGKQHLPEIITDFRNGLIVFNNKVVSKPTGYFITRDSHGTSISLSLKLPFIRVNIVTLINYGCLNQNLKIMIVLKSDYFSTHERLTRFINENHIKREDILAITQAPSFFTIFFYADDAVEEITHGIFS
ncbi:hypothetical protein [Pedobacter sp. UBA5917]|uniref:hypothetical protein n=1 Tax=Pedobacter sp. UBA5917 TaxID=1947061 RepID=UPI0025F6CAB5|nr:hypothetical protein [Pedobacter sp. UBA5917]